MDPAPDHTAVGEPVDDVPRPRRQRHQHVLDTKGLAVTAPSVDAPVLPALSLNRLGRIASVCYDHRRRVLAVWILLLVVLTGARRAAGGDFKDRLLGGDTESEHARSLLAKSFPAESGDVAQVVFHATDAAAASAIRSAGDATVARLRGADRVAAVRGPFDPGVAGQVSADGRT